MQRLEPGSAVLLQRVNLAYTQGLMLMFHYPEAWHEHVLWCLETGGLEKAQPVLGRAQVALPGCALLHFVAADLEEGGGNAEGAKAVYEGLARALEGEVPPLAGGKAEGGADAEAPPLSPFGGEQGALIWVQYMRFLRRTADAGHARQVGRQDGGRL